MLLKDIQIAQDISYDTPYYSPEKWGLDIIYVGSDSAPYSFDLCVLWKHKETGTFLFGMDVGCSCPTPFDNHHSLTDIEDIGHLAELLVGWRVDEGLASVQMQKHEMIVAAVKAGLK